VIVVRVLAFVGGSFVVAWTLLSAVRAVVLPRAAAVRLSRWVFVPVSEVFRLLLRFTKTWDVRDRILALYGPIGLLALPVAWLVLVLTGYTAIYWSLGGHSLRGAFTLSGTLFTFGFAQPKALPQTVLNYSEAALGLGLVALLISYLPSMYAAFSRREQLVALLEVRAGNPPSVAQLLRRFYIIHGFDRLSPMFARWEEWFADVEETHTSQPAIVFFRSPLPNRSWLTTAGAVLDSASFVASTLDQPRDAQAELCVRSGYLCLRRIAGYFGIPYDPDPASDDPISIERHEYDEVYEELASLGVPLKADRDQAWRDFVGWRVNYDTVLVALAQVIMAPPAPWSSDRLATHPPQGMPRRFRPWVAGE
jgi:hypothetical protein